MTNINSLPYNSYKLAGTALKCISYLQFVTIFIERIFIYGENVLDKIY